MSWLESLKTQFGFDQIAWTPLHSPKSFHFYQEWLDRKDHGEMTYLARHAPQKKDPSLLLESAQSVIMVSKSYVPLQHAHGVFSNLRVASYAQNKDYHHWLTEDLHQAALKIKEIFPEAETCVGTDSLAFLERDYGAQAGLGWVGKNTCLIDPKKGSFFFLGEILTSLPCGEEKIAPLPDFCGTCMRCLEICPTQAIEAPRRLNATKCISYWTIESKQVAPFELREKFNDWFFGCDLCQSVCPWNQKPFKKMTSSNLLKTDKFLEGENSLIQDLRQLLVLDDTSLKTLVAGTPFERAKAFGLRRNAFYVIGNRRIQELLPEVRAFDKDPKLFELKNWALERLNS